MDYHVFYCLPGKVFRARAKLSNFKKWPKNFVRCLILQVLKFFDELIFSFFKENLLMHWFLFRRINHSHLREPLIVQAVQIHL